MNIYILVASSGSSLKTLHVIENSFSLILMSMLYYYAYVNYLMPLCLALKANKIHVPSLNLYMFVRGT